MHIVNGAKTFMLNMGAAPILYLMLALSVVSIAVIIERAWFFFRAAGNVEKLASQLEVQLAGGGAQAASARLADARSSEAQVLLAGLAKAEHGVEVVSEAMSAATSIQRMRLERGLAYLGTLGSNAPFIGLLGTVVGIIMAFDALGSGTATAETSALLMASIAEALVATAIGLAVAIPAIVAFNYFQRRIKTITTNSEALGRVLIGWLKERQEAARVPVGHPMVRRLTLTPPVLCVGKEA